MDRRQSRQGVDVDMPIDELSLSRQTFIAIDREGIKTLGQLLLMTELEVGAIKNVGPERVVEIAEAIKPYGTFLAKNERAATKARRLYAGRLGTVPARIVFSQIPRTSAWAKVSRTLNDHTLATFALVSPDTFSQRTGSLEVLTDPVRTRIRRTLASFGILTAKW